MGQCLNVNLGAGFIKLASASEGDWTCLLCKSAPLEKLRTNLLAPFQGKAKIGQRGVKPAGARALRPQSMAGLRPVSPRMSVQAPPRPGTPALSQGRLPSPGFPSPRVGPGVSIQRVPTPPQRPTTSPMQDNFEKTKLQLSKYAGLVVVPVKEQTGQVEAAIREVEAAGQMLRDAAAVAARNLKNGQNVIEVKEFLAGSVQNVKAQLIIASQKL